MGQKMRCGSQLVDSYIYCRRQEMRRYAESLGCDSPMRVERRRLKATNEKRAQEAREMEANRVEKEMLDNLASRLKAKIGFTGNYIADDARARYVEKKMMRVELMGEEDDTSRVSELIALAEAGLHAQEEDNEFMSQVVDEAETAYYKQKADEAEAEDQLFSQAADMAKAAYYKRKAEERNVGQSSKRNDIVIKDCATDDSDNELLIDNVSD